MTEAATPRPGGARPDRRQPSGSFPRARTLFHLQGIPVRLDWSWFLIATIVAYLFHTRMMLRLDGYGAPAVAAVAAVAALLFFASLLAHEAGHALTSLDRGIPVQGITLFVLGGVTESTHEARRARDEFVVVGIGPFISIVLAALFGLLYTGVRPAQPFAIVFGYLAWANLLLGVFNLVPGYPLDGGRLLRSILWGITGQRHRSTRWAARVGQAFAALLAASGVWLMIRPPTGDFGGLWQVLIAVFLYRGAAEAHGRARLRERLAGLTARDLMGTVPPELEPGTPLHQAVLRLQERPSLLWPVGDPLVGTVGLDDVHRIPREDWWHTTVRDIAHAPQQSTVAATAGMEEVLELIVDAPRQMLVVVDGGHAVGLLTPSLVTEPARG